MSIRTQRRTLILGRPFRLGGVERELPAGAYVVDTDEEAIDGPTHTGWRRIKTILHLPSLELAPLPREMVTIDGAELDRVLELDRRDA